MFELLVGALGAPLAKFLAKQWLGDTATGAIAGGVIDYLKGRGIRHAEARQADYLVHNLADRIIEQLAPYFAQGEARGVEIEPVATALQATLSKHADSALVLRSRLDPGTLYQALLDADPAAARDQPDLYKLALKAASEALCAIAERLPRFQANAVKESLDALGGLARQSEEILRSTMCVERIVVAGEDRRLSAEADYDARYRERLRSAVRKLRLFGLDDYSDTPSDLPLSIAYIPLRLRIDARAEGWLPQLDYPELLALLPAFNNRLLVIGPAGSGKTTLMQWTALNALGAEPADGRPFPTLGVEAARLCAQDRDTLPTGYPDTSHETRSASEFLAELSRQLGQGPSTRITDDEKPWHRRTPFLVRLRDCGRDGRLPKPADLPTLLAREAGDPPPGWVENTLRGGDALVLLDGIDEVPDQRRDEMRDSIKGYFDTFGQSQFVVTSRPAAVLGGNWADLFGPWRAVLQPMAPVDIERCIEQWHEALTAECRGRAVEPPDIETASELAGHVLASPALTQLAETPLLCAAICYLHRVRRGELPRRAASLYDELCKQLVHRLDAQRLKDRFKELAIALVGLDLEDKLALLARIAHFMVREQASPLDVARAITQVEGELRRLRKLDGHQPAKVLRALQERSGVLRGASPDEVEFAHNALRSWLAAGVFADEGAVNDLVDKATTTDDPDLPVLAAARGSIAYRENLIRVLLTRARANQERQRGLQIMALRCGGGTVDSQELRADLEKLEAQVFPPRDLREASQLAELGPRVVPLLRRTPGRAPPIEAMCVRTLRLIGSDQASPALDTYLDHDAEEVLEELAQAVNPLRIGEVRASVASCEPAWGSFAVLRHLRPHHLNLLDRPDEITVLNLGGCGLRSAEPLVRFAALQELSLRGTQIEDITPLRDLKAMRRLWLDEVPIRDLAPLRGLVNLQQLSLAETPVRDLGPLADLRSLQELRLAYTGPRDLGPLAEIRSLRRLWIHEIAVEDLEPLRQLSGLEQLWLSCTAVRDLAPLSELHGLQVLSVAETQVQDITPVRRLKSLRRLLLDDTRVRKDDPVIAELRARGVEVSDP